MTGTGALFESLPDLRLSTYSVRAGLLLRGIGAASVERPSRLNGLTAATTPLEVGRADFEGALWPDAEEQIWTEPKNKRRCDLIKRKYRQGLSPVEIQELGRLQAQMLRYRRLVAPLPLDESQKFYEELLARISSERRRKS